MRFRTKLLITSLAIVVIPLILSLGTYLALGRYLVYKQQVQNVKDMAAKGQSPKLKEPVFFWPLKNALYMAGQKLINGE